MLSNTFFSILVLLSVFSYVTFIVYNTSFESRFLSAKFVFFNRNSLLFHTSKYSIAVPCRVGGKWWEGREKTRK